MNDAGQPRAGASEELGRLLAELLDSLAGPAGLDGLSGLSGLGGLAGLGGHAGHAGLAGPECRICPVCRAVALLRQTRPEVLEHLVAAAGELAAAVRLVVTPPDATEAEEPAADEGGPDDDVHPGSARPGREPVPIERIDVTD